MLCDAWSGLVRAWHSLLRPHQSSCSFCCPVSRPVMIRLHFTDTGQLSLQSCSTFWLLSIEVLRCCNELCTPKDERFCCILIHSPVHLQSILEGISLSQPQPKIPSELIKFLGKTFNAWHIAIPLLESHVMLFPQVCFAPLPK